MNRGRIILYLVLVFSLAFIMSCLQNGTGRVYKAPYGEEADQPSLMAWADLNVWVDDVMVKYRQDGEDGTSGSSTLTLYCAKNEFEPFQVLAYNGGTTAETIDDVTVTQTSGPGTIDDIYIYRMHYINASIPSRQDYETGFYPDPLVPKVDRYYNEARNGAAGWPSSGIPVEPSKVQGFWVDLGTTANTPAGTYTFEVRVKQNGQSDKIVTVTLNVWNFEIPSTSSLKNVFTLESNYLDYGHGLSLEPGIPNEKQQLAELEYQYVKSMLYHRLAPSTADGNFIFVTVNSDGSINDWSYWEIAYADAFDGTAITSGPYAGAKLSNIDIEFCRTTGSRDSSETVWVNHLQSWWDKFTAEGWDPINKLYCYSWDEPAGNTWAYRGGNYTDYQIILLKAEGMTMVDTGGAGVWKNAFVTKRRVNALSNPGAGYTSFDQTGIYVPLIESYQYREICWPGLSVSRDSYPGYPNWDNRDHFGYVACNAHGCGTIGGVCNNNGPDLMLETPPVLTRGFAWIMWYYRVHGFLYYTVNGAYAPTWGHYGDPWYSLATYFGGNGDGLLFFPGVPDCSVRDCDVHTPSIGGINDIPIESIRLKLFREAWEDREYMEILRNLNGGDTIAVDTQVNSTFTSVGGEPGAYYNLQSDPSYILNARQSIANEIIAAQGPICEANDQCFYISPTGSDATGDGSFENPWATLQYGGPRLQAGDILYVMGGTYTGTQGFTASVIGSAQNPITVKAYPGERPIFTGTGALGEDWIQINGDYWIIDGLEIHNENSVMNQIIDVFGDYNTIQNCYLSGRPADQTYLTLAAIRGYISHHNKVLNCRLEYVGDRSYDGVGDIIALVGDSDYWTIHNNTVRYGAHSGIGLIAGGGHTPMFCNITNNTVDQYDYGIGWGLGIGVGSITTDDNVYNLVENNWVRSGGDAVVKQAIQVNSNGNTIRNNIFFNAVYKGFVLHAPNNVHANRNLFYNNVIYGSGAIGLQLSAHWNDPDVGMVDNLFANNIWLMNALNSDYDIFVEMYHANNWWTNEWGDNIFKNNIIRHTGPGQTVIQVNYPVGITPRTEYYTLNGIQTALPTVWFNNLEDDPLFVNAANSNFKLQEFSPAIDAGVPVRDTLGDVGGWSDLTHQGSAPDIGAWESPYTAFTGNIWHMAVTGTNHAGCGSEAQPCASLLYILNNFVQPGDIVIIHEGIYPNEPAASHHSIRGTETQWVTISGANAFPQWAHESIPVFTNPSANMHIMNCEMYANWDAQYFILKNIKFLNVYSPCINIDDCYAGVGSTEENEWMYPANHIILENIITYGCRIKLSGVDNFEIRNTTVINVPGPATAFNLDGDHDGYVHHNTVINVSNLAVIKGGSSNIRLSHNFFRSNKERSYNLIIGDGMDWYSYRPPLSQMEDPKYGLKNVSIVSNIMICDNESIVVDVAHGIIVAHNTIIRTKEDSSFWGVMRVKYSDTMVTKARNVKFFNNIFYSPQRSAGAENVNWHEGCSVYPQEFAYTFNFSNNLWYCYENPSDSNATTWCDDCDYCTPNYPHPYTNGNLFGQNPLFVSGAVEDLTSWSSGNFRLQSGSPAIGAGVALDSELGILYDYDGNPLNPLNPSIGAFEYTIVSGCTNDAECSYLDDLPCVDGYCDVDGVCKQQYTTNSCVDGNECTDNDACSAGVCIGTNVADNTPCTSDGNECTNDVCLSGSCTHNALPNNTPCSDDGMVCTENEQCQSGMCIPTFFNHALCTDRPECNVSTCTLGGCTYSECPVPSDLVLWWPFDGNWNDYSGNNNTPSCSNCPMLTSDRFGQANSAYNFDGVNDLLYIANSDLSAGFPGKSGTGTVNEMSIALWVNLRSLGNDFLCKYSGSWCFWHDGGGFLREYRSGASGTTAVPLNEWVHVAMTYDGTNVRLYLNSNEDGITSFGGFPASSSDIHFGNDGDPLDGYADDVRLYTRALTPQEIQELYQGALECFVDADCDNGDYCDGIETCVGGFCQAGTPIDCSANDISAIATCDNIPDDNPDTWDYRDAFSSQCVEPGTCTTGDTTISHTCNVVQCGAECAVNSNCACPADSCVDADGDTYADDYVDYPDYGSCLGDCTCDIGTNPGQPCEYTITYNDGIHCPQCTLDSECNDGLYCTGTETCVAGFCQIGVPVDCNDYVSCTIDSCNEATDSCDNVADDGLCDNGLWCDGAEICNPSIGCQAGTPQSCDDGINCTVDSCNEALNSCDHIDITECVNDDTCCPADCNHVTDNDCPLTCDDADEDTFFRLDGCGTLVDCNDNNSGIYPGANESCSDGIDQDCDGSDLECPLGDVNRDLNVNLIDLILASQAFGCTADCGRADTYVDGRVNILDLIVIGKNFT